MRLTSQERALLSYALGLYRAAAAAGSMPLPAQGVEEIDRLAQLVAMTPAADDVDAGDYQGIGERRGDCLCATCRTIVEGQLRELLGRVPADKRSDMIDRVEGALVDAGGR